MTREKSLHLSKVTAAKISEWLPSPWLDVCQKSPSKGQRATGAALAVILLDWSPDKSMKHFDVTRGTYDAARGVIRRLGLAGIKIVWSGASNVCDINRFGLKPPKKQAYKQEVDVELPATLELRRTFMAMIGDEAIDAAWRTQQKIFHPDKGGDPEVSARFNQLYQKIKSTRRQQQCQAN